MCETCPPGTTTTYGGTIEGGGYPGQMIETVPIEGSAQGGVISGDYFGSSTVGSPSTVPADLVPTLSGAGVDSGLYGHPMFQVIADRKLAPGESLPAQAGVSATPQSDKTAQAPKKK